MSIQNVILNLKCTPSIEKEIEKAFINSGVQIRKEQLTENSYKIYFPSYYWSLSLALHIISSKIDELEGFFEFSDGKKYDLTSEGVKQFERFLVEDMFKEKEIIPVETQVKSPIAKTLLDYTPEQWGGFLKIVGEVWTQIKTAGSSEKKHLAYPVYILIGIVFGGFIYLAVERIIDSQSVTFLFGIIIGSLIPFLREFIIPQET